MKIGLLVASISALACSPSAVVSVDPPATVQLKVGASVRLGGGPWSVRFDSVTSDSRCPVNVECFWAGEVLLAMELTSPLADPGPSDNPHFGLGSDPVTVQGFRFTALEVTPAPRAGRMPDRSAYSLKLHIDSIIP